jgi:hypothetical protein
VDEEWLGMGVWCIYIPEGGCHGEMAEPMGRGVAGEVGGYTTGCGGGRYIRVCVWVGSLWCIKRLSLILQYI